MVQLGEYDTFKDLGKDYSPSMGYKNIRVHLVYDVNHDGHHKAILVADGHLTDIPVESVYSWVVYLRGILLIVFISDLNKMETWATYIGNT